MEEVEKVSKALQLVEYYESYLFRRAGGVVFIVWGILGPLIGLLVLKSRSIADIMGISVNTFMWLVPPVIWLVGLAITAYVISSASIIASRMRKMPSRKHLLPTVVLFLIWVLSFILAGVLSVLGPKQLILVSWLWAGGGASLLTYLVLRKISDRGGYPEVLLVGLILLIASLPIVNVTDTTFMMRYNGIDIFLKNTNIINIFPQS